MTRSMTVHSSTSAITHQQFVINLVGTCASVSKRQQAEISRKVKSWSCWTRQVPFLKSYRSGN